jgi:conjugative transfer signal peptidase TraF
MRANRECHATKIHVLAASALASWLALTSKQTPFLIYNGSLSAPIGLYAIDHSRPNRGDLVLVRPWPELARLLGKHDILPAGVPLLKTVVGIADDDVCRHGYTISINGIPAAEILAMDANGRELSGWASCRKLVRGEFFLLQPHPRSFDSRYFGPVLSCDVIGIARAI